MSDKDCTINVRISGDLVSSLDASAQDVGMKRSAYVRQVLKDSLQGSVFDKYPGSCDDGALMKNGRPFVYACSGPYGWSEDGNLFTDLYEEIDGLTDVRKVADWIRKEIRHDVNVCSSSSYSLKHMLERDTGVYLTNNQFKDALFLAGYYPVNYTELNWHYELSLTRYDDHNINPFYIWAKSIYKSADTPEGTLVEDMSHDADFPVFADKDIILDHMSSSLFSHAVTLHSEVEDVFISMWNDYEKFRSQQIA